MSAKDRFLYDTDKMFDTDVFAEEYTIDNTKMNIIVDRDALVERQKKEFDGIHVADILYFAKKSDFHKTPKVNEWQKINGVPHSVVDVRENDGILEIMLIRNAS